jgi:hypothetical protein
VERPMAAYKILKGPNPGFRSGWQGTLLPVLADDARILSLG